MGKYTVYLPGGGSEEVNASNASAALGNVGGGGSLTPPSSSSNSGGGGGGGGSPAPAPASSSSSGGSSQYGSHQGYWTTVNGPRTVPQMAAELAAVGYNGPTDPGSVMSAYARTAGGTVTADNVDNQPGGAGPLPQGTQQQQQQQATQNLGGSIDQLLAALQSGNQAAAAEAAHEFSLTFGLDQEKFQEAITEYNKNFGLQESAVTGTYNGAPTLAAQKQAADIAAQAAGLTGYLNGTPTLATRQLGLDALKTAATLQGDPFRQQEYLNGLSAGGYSNSIDALLGKTNQPAFQAPTGTPAGSTATLTNLAARAGATGGGGAGVSAMSVGANDPGYVAPTQAQTIAGRAANGLTPSSNTVGVTDPGYVAPDPSQRNLSAPATSSSVFNPGSTSDGADPVSSGIAGADNAQMNASLAALPAPNKIVGRNFLKEDPTTQAFDLSAESAKTGLPMDTIKSQINATMPTFDAPTGMVDAT